MLRRVGVGSRQQDPELRVVCERRPDLLPVDDELVAVADGLCPNAGQIASRTRFAEQLAPDLLAREHRRDEPPLLLLGAVHDEDRAAVPGPDGVDGLLDLGPLQLVLDDELRERVCVEAPRLRPVRDDVSGFGQFAAIRVGVLGEPGPDEAER